MSMSIKERFNLLLKKNEEEPATFDEGDFNLKIFGGPSQADLIRVEADLINPQKFGNKSISLNCKWFNKTEKDLTEIQGTKGQVHYQPSLKDVGTTIRVECFPEIQGKSYEGMPIHRDIGPLVLEKETEEDAQEFVESGSATLLVRVTRTNKSTHYSETDGLIKVTSDEISVKTKQGDDFLPLISSKLNERFPSYQADSKNHKLLKIFFNEEEYVDVLVQQSRMRDVIVLASKMLAGKRIMDLNEKKQEKQQQNTEQTQTTNASTQSLNYLKKNPEEISPTRKKQKASAKDLIQIAELTKQCKQLNIQNDILKKQYQQVKAKQQQYSSKLKTSQERLQNLSKNYFVIQKQLNDIKSKNSSDDDKFVFVNNEIRVLKQQNESLKKNLSASNESLLNAQLQLKNYSSEQDKPTYQQLFDLYNKYKNESEILHQRLSYSQSQSAKYQQQIHLERQKNQELAYNFNKINSKCELLLRESKIPTFEEQKSIKKLQKARQQQIIKLKLQIKNIVDENDDLRKRVAVKSPQKLQSKNPKKAQLKQLQKLANRLSEAITEKDQIILNMREVNKELVAKVKRLEDQERQDKEKINGQK